MSVKLLIVRHGESEWNLENRIQGQADPPLSTTGRRQVEALAASLAGRRPAAVYTSPLHRALDTARALGAPHHFHPIPATALCEVHLGRWQGRLEEDLATDPCFRAWRQDPASFVPPAGESLDQVRQRLAPFLATVLATHRDGMIVLVTHSVAGRVLISYLLEASLSLVRHIKVKTASVSTVRVTDTGAVLECLGETSHLRTAAFASREASVG